MTEGKAKRKPHRSATQLSRDRRRIAELYLEGWLQADIADEVGLSQSTISNDLTAIHKQWLASALMDFNEAKSQELARVDRLEREYWRAWRRSCEDAETVTRKAVEASGEMRKESTKTAKGQAGNSRFLTGVQWCIERRCKILGFDAPQKFALSGGLKISVGGIDLQHDV